MVEDVSSDARRLLRTVLEEFAPGSVDAVNDDHQVDGTVVGESARQFNRQLLTALRKGEGRTRLQSSWADDGVPERYFDYLPKGSRPAIGLRTERPRGLNWRVGKGRHSHKPNRPKLYRRSPLGDDLRRVDHGRAPQCRPDPRRVRRFLHG